MDLLLRIAPFFALIAAGAVAGRFGLLNARRGGWLSAYTFWIGFPALLIRWLGDAPPPDPALARALLAYGLTMGVVLAAAPFIGRLLSFRREACAGLAMTSGVGNTAFLGAPLAVSIFGPAVRAPAASAVAVDFIALMAAGIAILQTGRPGGRIGMALRRVFLNPTVAGAATGLALSALQARLPVAIDRPLTWLAATASPVALVALGGLIGREWSQPERHDAGPLMLTLALKLLVAPALVWTSLGLVGAPEAVRASLTLLAACPTAVNVFIQTRVFDIHARGAALAVIAGTVISAASLSVLAHLLGG
ncbi:AEC family transporter [Phenylobacterium sp.]|uniref:AEC family transporter n=1 Tax=Phenylobacterium sp. TaxID=1871053 RepID=UPI0035B011AD